MTYRSSSTQFILTLGMSTLFLTVPCPPAPIIPGRPGRCGTRRIGGAQNPKRALGGCSNLHTGRVARLVKHVCYTLCSINLGSWPNWTAPIGRSTQGAETYTGWGFKSPEEVCSLHIMVAAQAERTVSAFPKLRRNEEIKSTGSRRSPQWVLTDNS